MNTQTQEALKMAHKSFMQLNERHPRKDNGNGYFDEEIQACKEALERPTNMVAVPADQLEKMQQELKQLRKQQAQEPVAWIYEWEDEKAVKLTFHPDSKAKVIPLYTHPAPSWQGLSDDEIDKIYYKTFDTWSSEVDVDFARAIEQALKEKNT